MPNVIFTANLQRHVPCPPCRVPGDTVREALEAVFAELPRLRGYIVDEHGRLRGHMDIYVDGLQIADRRALSDAVSETSRIDVMQALSGG